MSGSGRDRPPTRRGRRRPARPPAGSLTDRVLHHVERAAGLTVALAVLVILALISVIDFISGREVTAAPLYILPVMLGSWRFGLGAGLGISVLAALILLSVDMSGDSYSRDWILLFNTAARLGTFMLVSLLVAEVRRAFLERARLADHDHLTGLMNGRGFEAALESAGGPCGEEGGAALLMLCDLDGFKSINDRFGHARGDALLQAFATELMVMRRDGDHAARLGGDEFAMLICGQDLAELVARASAVHARLHAFLDTAEGGVGCSMGTVPLGSGTVDAKTLLASADAALYAAKRRGRGRIEHAVGQHSHPPMADIITVG